MTALTITWLVLVMLAGNMLWKLYARCCPACGGRTRHKKGCTWRDE